LKVNAFMGGRRYSIVSDESRCVLGIVLFVVLIGMLGVSPLG